MNAEEFAQAVEAYPRTRIVPPGRSRPVKVEFAAHVVRNWPGEPETDSNAERPILIAEVMLGTKVYAQRLAPLEPLAVIPVEIVPSYCASLVSGLVRYLEEQADE